MTRTSAHAAHTVICIVEVLATLAAVTLTVVAGRTAWATATAWPPPVTAIASAYGGAGFARLAFEASRAWRALCRWHSWPHRQIRDRTEPGPRQRAVLRKEVHR